MAYSTWEEEFGKSIYNDQNLSRQLFDEMPLTHQHQKPPNLEMPHYSMYSYVPYFGLPPPTPPYATQNYSFTPNMHPPPQPPSLTSIEAHNPYQAYIVTASTLSLSSQPGQHYNYSQTPQPPYISHPFATLTLPQFTQSAPPSFGSPAYLNHHPFPYANNQPSIFSYSYDTPQTIAYYSTEPTPYLHYGEQDPIVNPPYVTTHLHDTSPCHINNTSLNTFLTGEQPHIAYTDHLPYSAHHPQPTLYDYSEPQFSSPHTSYHQHQFSGNEMSNLHVTHTYHPSSSNNDTFYKDPNYVHPSPVTSTPSQNHSLPTPPTSCTFPVTSVYSPPTSCAYINPQRPQNQPLLPNKTPPPVPMNHNLFGASSKTRMDLKPIQQLEPVELQLKAKELEILLFSGDNIEEWLKRMHQFFNHHNIYEAQHIPIISGHLESKALEWFQDLVIKTWKEIKINMHTRFITGTLKNPPRSLFKRQRFLTKVEKARSMINSLTKQIFSLTYALSEHQGDSVSLTRITSTKQSTHFTIKLNPNHWPPDYNIYPIKTIAPIDTFVKKREEKLNIQKGLSKENRIQVTKHKLAQHQKNYNKKINNSKGKRGKERQKNELFKFKLTTIEGGSIARKYKRGPAIIKRLVVSPQVKVMHDRNGCNVDMVGLNKETEADNVDEGRVISTTRGAATWASTGPIIKNIEKTNITMCKPGTQPSSTLGLTMTCEYTSGVVASYCFLTEVDDAPKIYETLTDCFVRVSSPKLNDKKRWIILQFVERGDGSYEVEFTAECLGFVTKDNVRLRPGAQDLYQRGGLDLNTRSTAMQMSDKEIFTQEISESIPSVVMHIISVWPTGIGTCEFVTDFMRKISHSNRSASN